MSSFGAYGIAYSGMYVNQAALGATSTNLANVDTTGASRVRVNSVDKTTIKSGGVTTGTGVSVGSITRARDKYLDSTYRTQNAASSYDSVKSGNLEYIDEILVEYDSGTSSDSTTDSTTGSSGVQHEVDDFFTAWSTLTTDSSAATNREAVVTAGTSLVSTLTSIDKQLQQLQTDAVNGAKDGVDSLNDLAGQVADLNQQISKAEVGGTEASYLRDQRDVLVDNMSALADISTSESSGTLQVTIGGRALVDGAKTHKLVVDGSGTTSDPITVKWADSDSVATIKSGSIGAYLEDADQTGYETIDSSKIPYDSKTTGSSSISTMRQQINNLITTLAVKVNALQTSGVDLNGDAGQDFFTTVDSTQPLSITNIQVNTKLTADSDKVVAGSSSADSDNTIANKIHDLAKDTTCYQSDGLSVDITGFYKAVTTWVGTAGDTAASSYTTQSSLVTQIDNQRQSTSSISLDEELANMMMYQKAYTGSSKVLSTIDSLLGDLIEDLG